MTNKSFRDITLASLQHTLLNDLLPELRSSQSRDFAKSISKLLARLRTDLEAAPTIAADQLATWRELAERDGIAVTPTGDPLTSIHSAATGIEAAIKSKRSSPELLRELSVSSSANAAWFKDVVLATRKYLDAYESAVPSVGANNASPTADPAITRQKLSTYLSQRYPKLPANPIRSFNPIPGGRSKETVIFELTPNDSLPTRLVLRRDIPGNPTGTSVFGEYALLQTMVALGLPVPAPIAGEQDAAHLGSGFIIVAEVTDSRVVGELFPELNDMTGIDASFALELTRALARLHSLRGTPPGVELGGHHTSTTPVQMVQNFQAMWDGITNKPPMAVATELAFAWLLSHPLPADRPRRLVHGDIGFHNLMMREGRLAAILDWELAHLGDPAEDIGYIRRPILQTLMPWDQFVSCYVAEGGDPAACDKRAVSWYSVWAHTRNTVYCAYLYDLAHKGQRSDINAIYPAIEYVARCQHYVAGELQLALQEAH